MCFLPCRRPTLMSKDEDAGLMWILGVGRRRMDAKDEDAGLMSILGVGRRRMDANGEVVRPDPENDDT